MTRLEALEARRDRTLVAYKKAQSDFRKAVRKNTTAILRLVAAKDRAEARKALQASQREAAQLRFQQQQAASVVRSAVIVERITKGETLQAVATDYGISRERVRQIVKKVGIAVGIRRSPTVDAMVAAYQAGEPLHDIAARHHYPYRLARAALLSRGIKVPPLPPRRKYLTTPHGTYYGWVGYKCRCDLCHAAYSVEIRRTQADRYARLGTLPPEKHGNYSTYLNWGCRCDPCRKANSAYNKPYEAAWRARQKAARQADKPHVESAPTQSTGERL